MIAFKPKAGFDYFETYDTRLRSEFRSIPDEVILTLGAAQSVQIKAIDSGGRPVPGVAVRPIVLQMLGKKDIVRARAFATVNAVTDGRGVALFDWIPRNQGVTPFVINPTGGYSCRDSLAYDPAGPAELTARVLRSTRLSGTVRLPDGRPRRMSQSEPMAGAMRGRRREWLRPGPLLMAATHSMYRRRRRISWPSSMTHGRRAA